ncbi:MAG: patatin-like phospholipase family protein [Desulfobacterota bacterium]|nr:patatin-like phospholipase family protein [Thermodesulfobacteriota bacterium]
MEMYSKLKKIAAFAALWIFFSALCGCPSRPTPLPNETTAPPKPTKVAVVLGAGASKGFAHIGVLKVLEGQKVPIHMVVGTSAGSLVGSLYASGLNAFQIQDLAMKVEKKDVIDYTVPDNGFIKGEKLEDFVNRTVRNTPIEKLIIRFYAVATDIAKGDEAVFVSGNTGKAVRASCSVPGVFQPVKMSGKTYVDGGVVSPVAVDVARRNGADVVIAVDISGGIEGEVPQGTMDTILQSVDIMYAKISEYQLKKADVVIRPNVRNIGSTEMEKRHQAILEGEKAAFAALPEILKIVNRLRQEQRL